MRRTLLRLCLLLTLGHAACSTTGEVRVAPPEVFARSRVLRDRDREVSWLEKQLEEAGKSEPSFQALRDVKELESFYHSLKGTWDPARGQALDLMRTKEANAQKIEIAQQKLTLGRLDRALYQEYDAWGAPSADTSRTSVNETPLGLGSSAAQPAQPPAEADTSVKDRLAELEKSVNELKAVDDLKEAPLPQGRARTTAAQFSFAERFQHKKAARDLVMAAIREKQLDDVHDDWGSTLYELRFAMTLVPGDDTRRIADLHLELVNGTVGSVARDKLHRSWLLTLEEQVQAHQVDLQWAALTGSPIPRRERQWVGRALAELITAREAALKVIRQQVALLDQSVQSWGGVGHMAVAWENARRHVSLQLRVQEQTFQSSTDALQAWLARRDGKIATLPAEAQRVVFSSLAKAVYEDYRAGLGAGSGADLIPELLSTPPDQATRKAATQVLAWLSPYRQGGATFFEVQLHLPTSLTASAKFGQVLEQLELRARPRVVCVQPQEEAQNLSEVAAKDKMLHMVWALSAVLPKGVTVDTYNDYLRRRQVNMEAIQRNALVVGYADGTDRFGWLLGPSFRLKLDSDWIPPISWFAKDDMQVEYLQQRVTRAYTVSIALPVWQTEVRFRKRFRWLDRAGGYVDEQSQRGNELAVPLPGEIGELTHAILRLNGRPGRQPSLEPFMDDEGAIRPVYLRAGKPGSLVLRGKDLWRNPEVFLGTQKADEVEVTPDMGGLYATFEEVGQPAVPADQDAHRGVGVPVLVKTNDGEAAIWSQVVILPAAPAPTIRPFLRPLDRRLGPAAPHDLVRLEAVPPGPPTQFAGIFAVIRDGRGAEVWRDSKTLLLDARPLGVAIPMPAAQATGVYSLSLELQPAPGAKGQEVLVGGPLTFAYFKAAGDDAAKLTSGKVTFPKDGGAPNALTVDLAHAAAMRVAHPQLDGALQRGQVRLLLRKPGADTVTVTPTVTTNGAGLVLTVSGADLKAALEGTALRPKDGAIDAQVHVLAPAADGVQPALELPAGDVKLEQAK